MDYRCEIVDYKKRYTKLKEEFQVLMNNVNDLKSLAKENGFEDMEIRIDNIVWRTEQNLKAIINGY